MARRWQQLRPIQVNVLTMTTIERSETTRIRGFKNTRFTDGKPADQKCQEIGQFDDSVWALLRMIDEFLPVEVRDPNIKLSRFSNKKFLCTSGSDGINGDQDESSEEDNDDELNEFFQAVTGKHP